MANSRPIRRVGEVGVVFEITVEEYPGTPRSLVDATSLSITLQPPIGSNLADIERIGTLSTGGVDGKFQAVTQAGDLSIAGRWSYYGTIVTPTSTTYTETYYFDLQAPGAR